MAEPGPVIGRVDVSEPASISAGIADRYATAIFDIAKENKNLDGLETGVDALSGALDASADLRNVISSPLISRAEQEGAVTAVAEALKLDTVLRNSLALMAQKRRLFVVPQLVRALREALAEERGEVTAEVASAKDLTKTQLEKLTKTLSERVGKKVTINATVDEDLIGGLVVKVGSKMIDSSIRSRLNSLQNAMKEVG
ncbi:ATP synthase F1 subcomplex delta subunit [Cribrihabitans marinus]|uniref:ATP synthase subunit delta n=1 Tax=Cribrihabitans marinus TaxID=1227549 RepID=A0A1H7AFJ6_9RHOB|nr:ATP synthase F1 subcomplex delta subunit [Cribrihabitans marinus]